MVERLEEGTAAIPEGRWLRDAAPEAAAHGRHPGSVTLAAAAAAYGTLAVIVIVIVGAVHLTLFAVFLVLIVY